MKYAVGDRVKIKSAKELDYLDNKEMLECGYVDDMAKYGGKIATITRVVDSERSSSYYSIDIDNGNWSWEDIMLEDTFPKYSVEEYGVDNGDNHDDKIENLRFKYVIGYHRYENKLETFEGFIENFYPSGKSCFIDENDKILLLPYDRIEFIIPKENDNG